MQIRDTGALEAPWVVFHPVFDFRPGERAALCALPRDVALTRAAAARDWTLSRSQLAVLGFDDAAVAVRVRRGALFRRGGGVYGVGRAELSRRGELRAALLRCGRGAAISHRTAGWLRDVLDAAGGRVHLTTCARIARPGPGSGIDLHYTRGWLAGDVEWIDGFPCTSIARTLADLAAVAPAREFAWAWDNADQQVLLSTAELALQIGRGRPGASVLRRRLEHRDEVTPDGSVLEAMFLELCRGAGLPTPRREWPLAVEDRTGRVDFVFWPERVAVELDSRRWHAIQAAHDRDREKDLALREAGFDPHRYPFRLVRDQGPRVAAAVGTAIVVARRRLEVP